MMEYGFLKGSFVTPSLSIPAIEDQFSFDQDLLQCTGRYPLSPGN